MQQGIHESPLNPLPAVVWLLALPIIASEIYFGLGRLGFIGGAEGIGLRLGALERTAFAPEMLIRMWQTGSIDPGQLLRIVTYPFIQGGFAVAAIVLAFLLALGKMVATEFRPWALVVLFLGSAIGGALVYTLVVAALVPGGRVAPLVGAYPAVYGLVGAFTFLLWTRLAQTGGNRMRAFTLICALMVFQLVFGLSSALFTGVDGVFRRLDWLADIAGFATGFGLSFLVVDGGVARALRHIRQR